MQIDEELSLNIKGFYFVSSNERNISSKQTRFASKIIRCISESLIFQEIYRTFSIRDAIVSKEEKSRNEIRLFTGLNYILARTNQWLPLMLFLTTNRATIFHGNYGQIMFYTRKESNEHAVAPTKLFIG